MSLRSIVVFGVLTFWNARAPVLADGERASGWFLESIRSTTGAETGGVVMVKGSSGSSQRLRWTPNLTVTGAIESMTAYAWKMPKSVFILRLGERFAVPLQGILEKKTADLRLLPDDILEVTE